MSLDWTVKPQKKFSYTVLILFYNLQWQQKSFLWKLMPMTYVYSGESRLYREYNCQCSALCIEQFSNLKTHQIGTKLYFFRHINLLLNRYPLKLYTWFRSSWTCGGKKYEIYENCNLNSTLFCKRKSNFTLSI